MDDELIGYIYKFVNSMIDQLHTNITGIHEIFMIHYETYKSLVIQDIDQLIERTSSKGQL